MGISLSSATTVGSCPHVELFNCDCTYSGLVSSGEMYKTLSCRSDLLVLYLEFNIATWLCNDDID